MSPQMLMRIALVLMCLGLCPFILGLAWAVNAISAARNHAAEAVDSFLMVVVLLASYGFAVVISGGGTLLSFWAVKRTAILTSATSAMRIVVAVALSLPLFLYAAIRLPSL